MGAAPQGKQLRQQKEFPSNYSLLLLGLEGARQEFTRNVKEVGVSPDYEVSDHHPNEALSGLQITGKNARPPTTYFIISKGSERDPLVDALTNSSSTFMILFAVDLDQCHSIDGKSSLLESFKLWESSLNHYRSDIPFALFFLNTDRFGHYFDDSNPNKSFLEECFPEFKDYVCPSPLILSRQDFALSFLQTKFVSKTQSEIYQSKIRSDSAALSEIIRCVIEKNITSTL